MKKQKSQAPVTRLGIFFRSWTGTFRKSSQGARSFGYRLRMTTGKLLEASMKAKKRAKDRVVYSSASSFAKSIDVSEARSAESKLKAKLVAAIRREIESQELSHEKVAKLAGVARANITGIISGSVTSVTLDRLVRIASARGLSMDLAIKKSA